MTNPIRILGISGSLRSGSYNGALLMAADGLVDDLSVEIFDLRPIPMYDPALDGDDPPAAVVALRSAIAAADGVLIATPEYNFSVSGVLKNALDWASRPAFASSMVGKPTGVMSASPAATGGVRAQQHLKTILLGMASEVYPAKEFALMGAMDKFGEDGALTHAPSLKFLREYLEGMRRWIAQRPAMG